ncbi:NAD-dependent epimerase/dehydratase family protein [Planctomycetaceae bacterium SH139]
MNRSSQQPIRIGVVGCGAIAELFHLPALAANPATAAGIYLADTNSDRAQTLKSRFAACGVVEDYRELKGKVDGVVIASPPSMHFEMSKFFLANGVHVLCEKPLTESLPEAEALVRLAKEHRTHLAVNQTRRFFPTYQRLRSVIASGVLGELRSIVYHDGIEFDWPAASPHHFQPGAKGAWSDTGVHLVDTICYWLDATPELVNAEYDATGGPEALATIKLQHQACQIELKVSRLGPLSNRFQIEGALGRIDAATEDWDEFSVKLKSGKQQRFKCGSNKLKYLDFAKPCLENFIAVIRSESKPMVTGESTLPVIGLMSHAYERFQPYQMTWNAHLSSSALQQRHFQTASPARKRRILVTGASGFLGGRLVESLQLSGWGEPVATIRNWSRAARIARHPIEIVVCDIMDKGQVERAVANVDAIVHCAYTDDRETIVTGTKNLLEAAVQYKIQDFVYLSSAEVYGPDHQGLVSEQITLTTTGRAYGDAKLEAEQVCRSFHDKGLLPTILRPSLIYGPFSASWSIDVAQRLQSGKWGLFGELGEGRANLVYVDDLVQAILRSLESTAARGETFNVNGPQPPTWNEYFQAFNAQLGLPPLQQVSATRARLRTRVLGVVGGITSAIKSRFEDQLMEIYLRGGLASRMMKRLKGELDATPSSAEINDLFVRSAVYDDLKIRQTIDYQPAFDLTRGLQLTVDWLRLHELAERTHDENKPASLDSSSNQARAVPFDAVTS